MTTPYCDDDDLDARYGDNIPIWADISNTWVRGEAETAEMTARRLAARTYAAALTDDVLRGSELSFSLPLVTVPLIVVDANVKLAAEWMASARGKRNNDPLEKDKQDAMATLSAIATGTLRIER